MFIELHLTTGDRQVLDALARMNYLAVASTVKVKGGFNDLLVMRKVLGPRRIGKLAITYVIGNNRYALNKYITNDMIDVVTILPGPEYPSRRQLSMIEDEGKYVELVVLPFTRRGLIRELGEVAQNIMDYSTRAIVSLGVGSLNDVKNPMDAVSLLTLLTGDENYWVKAVRDNPLMLIVDSIYKAGVCLG